jgi:hypothetical protein
LTINEVRFSIEKKRLEQLTKPGLNRGNCPSFEPLLNAFLEISLNDNPEVELMQEFMKKYA